LDAVAKTYFNAIERRRKVEKEASIWTVLILKL
jgi:hypothetical protein